MKVTKDLSPPLIAIILVSITISVVVAVGFWMEGIIGPDPQSENLEVVSVYAIKERWPTQQWIITITMNNTGDTEATLIGVYVNGTLVSDYNPEITTDAVDRHILNGDEESCNIYISHTLFESGNTIEVKLRTTTGLDYSNMINLP